jgi:hypothetical protein
VKKFAAINKWEAAGARMRTFACCAVIGAGFVTTPASAALTTLLTFSNALPDEQYLYATVTISVGPLQSGSYFNSVNFDINPITIGEHPNAILQEGSNFGLQKFGFNYNGIGTVTLSNFDPAGWEQVAKGGSNFSEFGQFELRAKGTGSVRGDPLKFIATTTDHYSSAGAIEQAFKSANSHGWSFAAHIAGFQNFQGQNSAYFAGGDISSPGEIPVIAEPVTSYIWGFGLSVICMPLIRRRNSPTPRPMHAVQS